MSRTGSIMTPGNIQRQNQKRKKYTSEPIRPNEARLKGSKNTFKIGQSRTSNNQMIVAVIRMETGEMTVTFGRSVSVARASTVASQLSNEDNMYLV